MDSRTPSALLLILLLAVTCSVFAVAPPANTIPIISHRTGLDASCEYITMDVLLDILWHNFDGILIGGKFTSGNNYISEPLTLCDSTGAVVILGAFRFSVMSFWPSLRWARYTPAALDTANAFINPDESYDSIDSTQTALQMKEFILERCSLLCDSASEHESIWYLEVFDEPSAKQLKHMLSSEHVYDDYFPSMFTQETSMVQTLPDGVFSWVKYKSDSSFTAASLYCPSVSSTLSMLHTIEDGEWAGLDPGMHLGTDATQANSIRAYFEMQYLRYDPELPPGDTLDNTPARLAIDAYPVRLAGYTWQQDEDSVTVLGSATDLWMLEHYENLLDSTFIPAGSHEDGPFTVNYVPQSFGRSGGEAIWDIDSVPPPPQPDTSISYNPYAYRIPSPAEFRMLCNIGLLRGAKGIFPFCITSYDSWKGDTLQAHNAGLLDINLIPFDDPYENWVYRDRNPSDYWYAPPDSMPPWTAADGSDFDPLYSVPSRPVLSPGDQQNPEKYLEWKFAPYGRLWNSVRGTFRQIAWIAPELSQLWWWFYRDLYDAAEISYNGSTVPLYFADPHVRVFTDSAESTCYLYYVNRFCRANNSPFEIVVDSDDFPSGTDFSEYALDHSRRFLIEGSESSNVYTFLDTLDAGEARLLQMFDGSLAADLRITDPDLYVIIPVDGDTLTDNASTVGTGFDIYGKVYNMGTRDLDSVTVYLEDITTDTTRIDSVLLSFNGLSTDSCYRTDMALASFDTTITPGTSDVGVHLYRINVEPISGEPDTMDNSATLIYMVRPRDYATEVLDDPWDMTEATSTPPAWKTNDIVSMTGWNATYTDSISGMFEGTITNPTSTNWMVLNTGSAMSDYINTSRYQNISLAGKAEKILDITLYWIDEDGDTLDVDLGVDLGTDWAEIGPVNIQSETARWDDKDAEKIWLEFSSDTHSAAADVRIGWVRLTE